MPVHRPNVSVVLPFHGSPEEAASVLDALAAVALEDGDEVVVADNTGTRAVRERPGVTVLRADEQRSAYYARNVAADAARNPWLLFVDADCLPHRDVVDRYFDAEPAEGCGVVVGEVVGIPGQEELVARYARSRGHLTQAMHWRNPYRPFGVTANLLVRRSAWEDVGGFHEGIRSGGDIEFCWRLQDAGWTLDYRPAAVVEHRHRADVRALSRQAARYAAGRAWIRRRYPGSLPRPTFWPRLARCLAGVVVWTATGRRERALFKALDAVYVASECGAYLLSNTPPGQGSEASVRPMEPVLVADTFPDRRAPDAIALARDAGARVEARARPVRADRRAARGIRTAYAEDDGIARRLAAAARLGVAAPVAVLGYLLRRRRRGWPPLIEVAPAARRLRAAPDPPRILHAGDERAEWRAQALAHFGA